MRFVWLALLALAQLASYLLFCKGFFPTKILLSESDIEQFSDSSILLEPKPDAIFNKMVFMVIDACRSDFMFSNNSHMHFTQSLLNSGYALGYTAYSNPPTVTLPRLKGITTGSTPSFIDAILNIAEEDTSSTLGDQDSWVKQLSLQGKKINMFGDDTWLKLFPNYFTNTDGTASFYVSDFTIVDNNVTRHLAYELSEEGQEQWDVLILHYLGLDHIGHKGGPLSSNMPNKQMEMDQIIKKIFEDVVSNNDDTLFVVLGDHGMNEVGNHGGSSAGETSPGLTFISSRFVKSLPDGNKGVFAPIPLDLDYNYYTKIDQIDLVPTLSALLGLDIPINSLGNFITNLLPLYSEKEQLNILLRNCLQLKVLLDKADGKVSDLHESITDLNDKTQLLEYIKSAKETLSRSSSDYNYTDIHYGILLYLFVSLIFVVWFVIHYNKQYSFLLGASNIGWFIVYGASFFGSSLIEEEHHIWWWFTTIYITYNIYKLARNSPSRLSLTTVFVLFAALRTLKGWNNSGQKYNIKSNIKIQTFITQELSDYETPILIGILLATTCAAFCIVAYKSSTSPIMMFVNFMSLCLITFPVVSTKFMSYLVESYDMEDPNLLLPYWCNVVIQWHLQILDQKTLPKVITLLVHIFYKLLIPILSIYLFKPIILNNVGILKTTLSQTGETSKKSYFTIILCIISMLLIIQTNFSNVPIFFALLIIQRTLPKIIPLDNSVLVTLSTFNILLQNLSFFQFGSTNSLSSVDLTNSFNGVSSYNMTLVGILTFISNWASPIFWSLSYLEIANDSLKLSTTRYTKFTKWDILFEKLLFNFTFYSIGGLLLILSCYNLRFHLFIWTVFSPKILYFLAWYAMNLVIDFIVSFILTLLYN